MGKRLQRNFDRSAATYDSHSAIQQRIGVRLVERLPSTARRILEVGCGTGRLTQQLHQCFPDADITAFDLSSAMVALAQKQVRSQNVTFVTADLLALPTWEPFDLIVSNACLHWLTDFTKGMQQLTRYLQPAGQLCFSVFGPATYAELAHVLAEEMTQDWILACQRFADQTILLAGLQEHFDDVKIQTEQLERHFGSLLDLLRTIKYSGTQGDSQQILTRSQLTVLERAYLTRFKSIRASYQVYYGQARARGKDA